eukprot:2821113-Pleurochrysis_carterae.AAC.11
MLSLNTKEGDVNVRSLLSMRACITTELGRLGQLRLLDVIARVLWRNRAQVAAKYDILVMMACHRLFVDSWPGPQPKPAPPIEC